MKAKLIKEYYNDPIKEPIDNEEYIGFNEADGIITFLYDDNGKSGIIRVDSADIIDYYRMDPMDDLTDYDINRYEQEAFEYSDIDWEDDEGPNPDEMRDWKYDR